MDYDYVVVGGGASGAVVAAELAADPANRVLLLECGGENPGGYTRGSEVDYAMWNLDGWGWSDLVPHFEALEKRLDLRRPPSTKFTEACLRAAEDAGMRRKDDLNDGDLSGVIGYQPIGHAAVERAARVRAMARRILFDGKIAIGVEYEQAGKIETVRARREILLCAGALETPKLLMRSGVSDVPAVGKNLMAHPAVELFFAARREVEVGRLCGFQRANHASYLPPGASDTGYVFSPVEELSMVLPRRRDWLRRALSVVGPVRGLAARLYRITVTLGKPLSRGTVTLDEVAPNHFVERDDLDTLMAGIRRARKLVAGLSEWGNFELVPGRRSDLEKFVLESLTCDQFSGTCRMGADSSSVVDTRLRVRGVERLRVADGSAIPIAPVSAMNAPSMMIGLRAARFAAEEQQKVQRA